MDRINAVAVQNTANQTPTSNARDATEQNIPPTHNQIQIEALIHQNHETTNLQETSSPKNTITTRPSVGFREIQNLKSVNLPGALEITNTPLPTRKRNPSYQKSRYIYDEALKSLNAEIDRFDAQKYHNKPYEALISSNIRPHYRKIRQRQQALTAAAEDLLLILEKEGMVQEEREVKEDIDNASSQIIAVKFQFGDSVSNCSEKTRQESDTVSNASTHIQSHHPTSGFWSLSSPPTNTIPTSTSPTKGWGIHSQTQTTSTIIGGITSTIPPPPAAKPHLHTVVCTAPTCTTDGIIHSHQYIPYTDAQAHTTPIVPNTGILHQTQSNQTSRETSPSTYNTTNNIQPSRETAPKTPNATGTDTTSRESNALPAFQQAAREEMSSQLNTLIQNINDMFIVMRDENQRLRTDVVQISQRMDQLQSNRASAQAHPNTHASTQQTNQRTNYRPPFPTHSHITEQVPGQVPFPAQDQHVTVRLNQDKAFKNLLNATTSKFIGKDVLEYAPWKRALSTETENLQLTPTQKLKLLEARTELEPHQIIKELRFVHIEMGPEVALQMVWEALDKIYHTPHTPSQQLLKKLTQGPTIKPSDTSALVSFYYNANPPLHYIAPTRTPYHH